MALEQLNVKINGRMLCKSYKCGGTVKMTLAEKHAKECKLKSAIDKTEIVQQRQKRD